MNRRRTIDDTVELTCKTPYVELFYDSVWRCALWQAVRITSLRMRSFAVLSMLAVVSGVDGFQSFTLYSTACPRSPPLPPPFSQNTR